MKTFLATTGALSMVGVGLVMFSMLKFVYERQQLANRKMNTILKNIDMLLELNDD